MRDIGILTFLHNGNYGSTLQAYALQRTLREMGLDCEHIDYRPSRAEKVRNLLSSGNSPRLVLEGMRKRSVTQEQAGDREKRAAINRFYEKRMALSPVCADHAALRAMNDRYARFVCGSDQIWNPVWLNPAYFLDFAARDRTRVAYAASLGVQELPAAGKGAKIARLTEPFAAISLREEEGAALMLRMTGRTCPVMPDPVCLLSAGQWLALAEEAEEPAELRSGSMLCYLLGSRPGYAEEVARIAKETGLSPCVIPVTAEDFRSGLPLLNGLSPEGFLRALSGAELLVTDSFHGLVMATLLKVPVRLLRRDREDDPERKNSRLDHFQRLMRTETPETLRARGRAWLEETLKKA